VAALILLFLKRCGDISVIALAIELFSYILLRDKARPCSNPPFATAVFSHYPHLSYPSWLSVIGIAMIDSYQITYRFSVSQWLYAADHFPPKKQLDVLVTSSLGIQAIAARTRSCSINGRCAVIGRFPTPFPTHIFPHPSRPGGTAAFQAEPDSQYAQLVPACPDLACGCPSLAVMQRQARGSPRQRRAPPGRLACARVADGLFLKVIYPLGVNDGYREHLPDLR
jgi:hypothetical protein